MPVREGRVWGTRYDSLNDQDHHEDSVIEPRAETPLVAHTKPQRWPHDSSVFIASLPSHVPELQLASLLLEHISQYASILHVKLIRDNKNMPAAFVQVENPTQAQLLIAALHLTVFHGRTLRCEIARAERTLYLSYLPPSNGFVNSVPLPSNLRLWRLNGSNYIEISHNSVPPTNCLSPADPSDPLSSTGFSIPAIKGKRMEFNEDTLKAIASAFGELELWKELTSFSDKDQAPLVPFPHIVPNTGNEFGIEFDCNSKEIKVHGLKNLGDDQSSGKKVKWEEANTLKYTMQGGVWEVKWGHRNDCVSAYKTLSRLPYIRVSWAHEHARHQIAHQNSRNLQHLHQTPRSGEEDTVTRIGSPQDNPSQWPVLSSNTGSPGPMEPSSLSATPVSTASTPIIEDYSWEAARLVSSSGARSESIDASSTSRARLTPDGSRIKSTLHSAGEMRDERSTRATGGGSLQPRVGCNAHAKPVLSSLKDFPPLAAPSSKVPTASKASQEKDNGDEVTKMGCKTAWGNRDRSFRIGQASRSATPSPSSSRFDNKSCSTTDQRDPETLSMQSSEDPNCCKDNGTDTGPAPDTPPSSQPQTPLTPSYLIAPLTPIHTPYTPVMTLTPAMPTLYSAPPSLYSADDRLEDDCPLPRSRFGKCKEPSFSHHLTRSTLHMSDLSDIKEESSVMDDSMNFPSTITSENMTPLAIMATSSTDAQPVHDPVLIDTSSIFVGGFNKAKWDKARVEQVFSAYGPVKDVQLVKSQATPSAFAFIKYQDELSCLAAIQNENGVVYDGRSLKVSMRYISPKYRNKYNGKRRDENLEIRPPPRVITSSPLTIPDGHSALKFEPGDFGVSQGDILREQVQLFPTRQALNVGDSPVSPLDDGDGTTEEDIDLRHDHNLADPLTSFATSTSTSSSTQVDPLSTDSKSSPRLLHADSDDCDASAQPVQGSESTPVVAPGFGYYIPSWVSPYSVPWTYNPYIYPMGGQPSQVPIAPGTQSLAFWPPTYGVIPYPYVYPPAVPPNPEADQQPGENRAGLPHDVPGPRQPYFQYLQQPRQTQALPQAPLQPVGFYLGDHNQLCPIYQPDSLQQYMTTRGVDEAQAETLVQQASVPHGAQIWTGYPPQAQYPSIGTYSASLVPPHTQQHVHQPQLTNGWAPTNHSGGIAILNHANTGTPSGQTAPHYTLPPAIPSTPTSHSPTNHRAGGPYSRPRRTPPPKYNPRAGNNISEHIHSTPASQPSLTRMHRYGSISDDSRVVHASIGPPTADPVIGYSGHAPVFSTPTSSIDTGRQYQSAQLGSRIMAVGPSPLHVPNPEWRSWMPRSA